MAIYSRCCEKDYISSTRKCKICHKSFTKFVVRVKDSATGKSRTKTVPNLKLAKDVEAKFKTDQSNAVITKKERVQIIVAQLMPRMPQAIESYLWA